MSRIAVMLRVVRRFFSPGGDTFARATSHVAHFHRGIINSSPNEHEEPERETVNYDLCIVGAGPAGLSAAIRVKQVKLGLISLCNLDQYRYIAYFASHRLAALRRAGEGTERVRHRKGC